MLSARPLPQILSTPFRPTLELTANPTVDVSNANSYTFLAQNIGRSHPLRRTILAVLLRSSANSSGMTATQDGVSMSPLIEAHADSGGSSFVNLFALDKPIGEASDFVVTMANGVRCKILVYSLIAKSSTPLAIGSITSTSGGLASLTVALTSGIIIPSGRPALWLRYTQQGSGTVDQYGSVWRGVTGLSALSNSFSMNASATATNTTYAPTGFVGDEDNDAILENASSTGAEAMAGAVW